MSVWMGKRCPRVPTSAPWLRVRPACLHHRRWSLGSSNWPTTTGGNSGALTSSSCTRLAARGRAPASVSSPREVRRRSGVRADVRSLVNRHESCCVGVAKANIRRLAKRKPSAIGANIAWTRMNPQGAPRSECADLVTFEGPLVAVRTEPLEGSISHSALVIFFHEQDWMDYYQG